jgi:YD repeat-containing protein
MARASTHRYVYGAPSRGRDRNASTASSAKVRDFIRGYGTSDAAQTSFAYTAGDTCSDTAHVTGKTVVTDAEDHTTTYCWDGKARVHKVIDAKGNSSSTDYNSRSNVASFTGTGQTSPITLDYSPTADDVGTITLPTTGTETVQYDDQTNNPHFPTRIYDFQNHNDTNTGTATFAYQYDSMGNLTQARDGAGDLFIYTYNGDGTLETVKDARNNTTTYHYYSGTTYNDGDLKDIVPA